MAKVYLAKDIAILGNHFYAQEGSEDFNRRTTREIRIIEDFPDDEWHAMLAGQWVPDSDGSNDSKWEPWWNNATPYWKKP